MQVVADISGHAASTVSHYNRLRAASEERGHILGEVVADMSGKSQEREHMFKEVTSVADVSLSVCSCSRFLYEMSAFTVQPCQCQDYK